jgi:hypothetical protein
VKVNVYALVLFSLIVLSSTCRAQAGPPQIPPGPLGDFDTKFLEVYTARIRAIEQTHPTYVEISGSNLILHRHGQGAESAKILPDIYHALKDVAHVPFTTYLALIPLTAPNHILTAEEISQLQDLSAKIVAARNALDTGHFDANQLVRQQEMIDRSLELLRDSIQQKKIDHSTLGNYVLTMSPLIRQNADEAGCDQIHEMHIQMMRWKLVMTQDEWSNLIAVNRSSHQPRYRNVATQYFAWLFNIPSPAWAYPGESERLIYEESLPRGLDTADLLISILIDADASSAFFGNRWRLSEDVLSDGAARCVAQLPDQDRTWHQ